MMTAANFAVDCRRIVKYLILYIIVFFACQPGSASACSICSGTCSVFIPASGTYLDPSYVASAPAVSTPTLVSLLSTGAPLALIDCRTADALAEPRIPGALVFFADVRTTGIAERFPVKDTLLILYDRGSATERLEAHRQLSEAGFTNILQYPEGIRGWVSAGHPTVPAEKESVLGRPELPTRP